MPSNLLQRKRTEQNEISGESTNNNDGVKQKAAKKTEKKEKKGIKERKNEEETKRRCSRSHVDHDHRDHDNVTKCSDTRLQSNVRSSIT